MGYKFKKTYKVIHNHPIKDEKERAEALKKGYEKIRWELYLQQKASRE